MAGFENYAEEVREIEQEIEHKGIILGIDWNDDVQCTHWPVRRLDFRCGELHLPTSGPSITGSWRSWICSASPHHAEDHGRERENGVESHGGPAWKAGKALWAEKQSRDTTRRHP